MNCPVCGAPIGSRPHECPYAPVPRVPLDLPTGRLRVWRVASWALAAAVAVTMAVRLAELVTVIRAWRLIGTGVTDADRGRLLDLARELEVLGWILSGLGLVYFVGSIVWFIITRRMLTRFGDAAGDVTGHWTFKGWRVLLLVTVALNLASNAAFSGLARLVQTPRDVAQILQRAIFLDVVRELILAALLFSVVRALREARRLTAPVEATTGPASPADPIVDTPAGPGAPSGVGPGASAGPMTAGTG
jgi:hypothetical protein